MRTSAEHPGVTSRDGTTDQHGRFNPTLRSPSTAASSRLDALALAHRIIITTSEMFEETAAEIVLTGASDPYSPVTTHITAAGRGAAEELLDLQLEATERREATARAALGDVTLTNLELQ